MGILELRNKLTDQFNLILKDGAKLVVRWYF